ncbi:MAG: U32 family peptidase [Asticcacaulis sp.]
MRASLSLGPLLYNWAPEKARDFYLRMADESDIERVFLGEVVCSKREPFHAAYWPEVIERLEAAGKEVILSTLALVAAPREIKTLMSLKTEADHLIEINDLTLLEDWDNRPFALGPYVNVYNEATLKVFEDMGATRVTLPFELTRDTLAILSQTATSALEIQVYGRLPLAISARCYHARAFKLHKDGCQFVCDRHPDGMAVDTLDGQPFLTVNGTQTQSMTCANLIQEIPDLMQMGISGFRLSPQDVDMVAIARAFRQVITGDIDPAEAFCQMETGDFAYANGFFHGVEGRHLKRA